MMTVIQHPSRDWLMPANFPYNFDEWYTEAADNIAAACEHVTRFDTAIQAGGHVGVWPWLLAKRFNLVLTFEPDAENLDCAVGNLRECSDNVLLSPKLLGDRVDTMPWHRDTDTGSHRVGGNDTKEMITIDGLELPTCDLICLDVEGYEAHAIMGATETIARHRPVIMVEARGHETKHGLSDHAAHDALRELGYVPVADTHFDRVYVPMPYMPGMIR